ncbi:hypothetical protein ES703_121864 [subsurface metagenome]
MFEKNLRLSPTKGINALLDVSDNKDIPLGTEHLKYRLLNGVNILILINKYVFELPAQCKSRLRWQKIILRRIHVGQKLQRIMTVSFANIDYDGLGQIS